MRYRLEQVKIDLFGEQDLAAAARRSLRKKGIRAEVDPAGITVLHRSLDARKKKELSWVYTLGIETRETLDLPETEEIEYIQKHAARTPEDPPVVIGSGPCGLFAALILARGGLRPILLERGRPVDQRQKDVEAYWNGRPVDPESNVQFGEGGAGTFSDGKLTSNIRDQRVRKVLEEFVRFGADPAILYRNRPHLGTDRLRELIPKMRQEIIDLGGEVRFGSRVDDLIMEGDTVTGVILKDGTRIPAGEVVLAVGHSARDTFAMLKERGAEMIQKPFSIGVRVEHPQSLLDQAQYGDRYEEAARLAGPAEYKLHTVAEDGRGVYTFCMCPGGEIVLSASEPETIVTNGMSNAARDGAFGNSGVLVDVRVEDLVPEEVLAGCRFQARYEQMAFELGRGQAPETVYGAFKDSAVYRSLPEFAASGILGAMEVFGHRVKGFDDPGTRMVGVETRSSSPVRILRGEDLQSNLKGVYPAGEGAGYAGGITSAAVDGIRIAEAILSKYSE